MTSELPTGFLLISKYSGWCSKTTGVISKRWGERILQMFSSIRSVVGRSESVCSSMTISPISNFQDQSYTSVLSTAPSLQSVCYITRSKSLLPCVAQGNRPSLWFRRANNINWKIKHGNFPSTKWLNDATWHTQITQAMSCCYHLGVNPLLLLHVFISIW